MSKRYLKIIGAVVIALFAATFLKTGPASAYTDPGNNEVHYGDSDLGYNAKKSGAAWYYYTISADNKDAGFRGVPLHGDYGFKTQVNIAVCREYGGFWILLRNEYSKSTGVLTGRPAIGSQLNVIITDGFRGTGGHVQYIVPGGAPSDSSPDGTISAQKYGYWGEVKRYFDEIAGTPAAINSAGQAMTWDEASNLGVFCYGDGAPAEGMYHSASSVNVNSQFQSSPILDGESRLGQEINVAQYSTVRLKFTHYLVRSPAIPYIPENETLTWTMGKATAVSGNRSWLSGGDSEPSGGQLIAKIDSVEIAHLAPFYSKAISVTTEVTVTTRGSGYVEVCQPVTFTTWHYEVTGTEGNYTYRAAGDKANTRWGGYNSRACARIKVGGDTTYDCTNDWLYANATYIGNTTGYAEVYNYTSPTISHARTGSRAKSETGDDAATVYAKPGDSIRFGHLVCFGGYKVHGEDSGSYPTESGQFWSNQKSWRARFSITGNDSRALFGRSNPIILGQNWDFSPAQVRAGLQNYSSWVTPTQHFFQVIGGEKVLVYSPDNVKDSSGLLTDQYDCHAYTGASGGRGGTGLVQIPGFGVSADCNAISGTGESSLVGGVISQTLTYDFVAAWVRYGYKEPGTCRCGDDGNYFTDNDPSNKDDESGNKAEYVQVGPFESDGGIDGGGGVPGFEVAYEKLVNGGYTPGRLYWGADNLHNLPGGGLADGEQSWSQNCHMNSSIPYGEISDCHGDKCANCSTEATSTTSPNPVAGGAPIVTYSCPSGSVASNCGFSTTSGGYCCPTGELEHWIQYSSRERDKAEWKVYSATRSSVKKTARVIIPYNFDTTAETYIENQGILYAGGEVSFHHSVYIIPRINTTVNGRNSYATLTPTDTKTQAVMFLVNEEAELPDKRLYIENYLDGSGIALFSGDDLCTYFSSVPGFIDSEPNKCRTIWTRTQSENPYSNPEGAMVLDQSFEYAVPDVKAGYKFCTAVGISHRDSHDQPGEKVISQEGIDGTSVEDGYGPVAKTSEYWHISAPSCRTIAKKTNFQVWNGNVFSPGDITTSLYYKQVNARLGDGIDEDAKYVYGSWGEYNVIASGQVNGFASAAADGYFGSGLTSSGVKKKNVPNYCYFSKLTIANSGCEGGTAGNSGISARYVGFGSSRSSKFLEQFMARYTSNLSPGDKGYVSNGSLIYDPSYYAELPTTPKTGEFVYGGASGKTTYVNPSNPSQSTFNALYLYINGDATMNSVLTQFSGVRVIHVKGHLTINANICLGEGSCRSGSGDLELNALNSASGYSDISEVPQVVIIADSIGIGSDVTQIDAWLIATGNPYADSGGDYGHGTINTCDEYVDGETGTDQCNKTLKVNGPVFASILYLQRTAGAWPGFNGGGDQEWSTDPAATGDIKDRDLAAEGSITPAEIFDFHPANQLWAYYQAQRFSQSVVTYSRELAPRY